MDIFHQLLDNVPIPKFIKVRQVFPRPILEDIEGEIQKQLSSKNLLSTIKPGQKIAITAGSRGIANIAKIIKEVIKAVKEVGGEPFIIPAMGSHGGASAEGQIKVLQGMGITEEYCGAPIRATMEVVQIGRTTSGLPVYIDKFANEADGIIIINRIKPHVGFSGKYESGLIKMITIGVGKQKGAEICHNLGFGKMAENIVEIAKVAIEKKNILCAIGILENAYDETSEIIAMNKDEIQDLEPPLLVEAKRSLAKIYFDEFDVLIVDEIGKNITGTGMDTNIIGRAHTPYVRGGPKVNKLTVLDLTEESHGNGNGIGLADFTTQRFFNKMKFDQSYPNALTSTVITTVKLPMILENDKLAIQGAIKTSNVEDMRKARIVRIKNTLELEYIFISESLLEEAKSNPNLEILQENISLPFDKNGNLL